MLNRKMIKIALLVLSGVALMTVNGCKDKGDTGKGSDRSFLVDEYPPVAVAEVGPTHITCPSSKPVKLVYNGDKSYDKNGKIVSYEWFVRLNGSEHILSSDIKGKISDVCKMVGDRAGVYTIGLTVEDNDGNRVTDSVDVKVSMVTPAPKNKPPVAQSGADKTVEYGGSVTLDGSHSYDPDGTIVKYSWNYNGNIKTGITVTYDNLTTVGDNTITLTVTDNDGATASDQMVVTVKPQNSDNHPPKAEILSPSDQDVFNCMEGLTVNAGEKIADPTILNLNGNGTDPDGDSLIYAWSAWSDKGQDHKDYTSFIDSKNSDSASVSLRFDENSFCETVANNCDYDNEHDGCRVKFNLNVNDGALSDDALITVYLRPPS